MAYINQTEINNFINKAQQKIAFLGSEIATHTENDTSYDDELALSDELSSLINSLIDPWVDWEEKDVMRYIHFYNNKAKITDIPYSAIPKLTMKVVWPQSLVAIGDVTQAELDAEIAARIVGDIDLQSNIDIERLRIDNLDFTGDLATALTEYTKTVNLFLPTGDNKTALEALTTALVSEIETSTIHVADGGIHVTSGEKTTWNAKVDTNDIRMTDARTPLSHTHIIADVTGLVTEIQTQVDDYVTGLALQDGVTPVFTAANVIEGIPLAIDIDDSGGAENLILNMTVPPPEKGDTGDPFTIGATGLASERFDSVYDAELDGFAFLGTDDGNLYFRETAGGAATTTAGWSAGTPFTGENGWSPILATQTVNSEREVFVILDWIGGSGTKPVLTPPTNPPDPLIWYVGPGGPTVFVNDATNIKGNIGATGATGDKFLINDTNTLANKGSYDGELQGFTLLISDVIPKVIYQKQSDTIADWLGPYEWQGPAGAPTVDAMKKSVYDPTSVVGDVFSMDNMVEGATTKILTDIERTNWDTAYNWGDHAGIYEDDLGNPSTDGFVLSSTIAGVRTWVAVGGGAWTANQDAGVFYLHNIPTIRDANENEVLGFTGVTGAKNYIELVNSHSGLSPFSPQLKAVGDDTAIGIKYETKGNNSSSYHGFVNNSVEQFRFSNYTFMMKEAGSIKSLDTGYLSLVNSGASLRVYNGSGLGTNFIGISELDISSGPNGIRFVSTKLGFFGATAVTQPSHITNPTGGATVDIEARAAINDLLDQMATLGLQAAS